MKVWYKNINDTSYTIWTYKDERRPDESFFVAADRPETDMPFCSISWKNSIPSLSVPSDLSNKKNQDAAGRALVYTKSAKLSELELAAAVEEVAPVQVNGWTFKGGEASGMALFGQLTLALKVAERMPELGISTVKFYDINGNDVIVPFESSTEVDAWDILLAVATQASAVVFKKKDKLKALKAANTIEAVNAITW